MMSCSASIPFWRAARWRRGGAPRNPRRDGRALTIGSSNDKHRCYDLASALSSFALLRSSIWVPTVLGIVVALGTVRLLHPIEVALGWQVEVDSSTALTLLGTLAASMFTFIVFVCSALLISVQLASAALTPRLIGIVLRARRTKLSLTVFRLTFTLTLAALARIKGAVPAHRLRERSTVAWPVCASFYLVDKVCHALRPAALWGWKERGRAAVRARGT